MRLRAKGRTKMKKIAVVVLSLALTSCAARTYRVCHQGEYTGDIYCWQPQKKENAIPQAREWVEPNRDGKKPIVVRGQK